MLQLKKPLAVIDIEATGSNPSIDRIVEIAIIKLMSLQLASHLDSEIMRAQMSLILSPARVKDLLPVGAAGVRREVAVMVTGVVCPPRPGAGSPRRRRP